MNDLEKQLLGKWIIDAVELQAKAEFGDISLEFTSDGRLTYTIHEHDREQKIFLIYRVEGNFLVTDQPSAPKVEKT